MMTMMARTSLEAEAGLKLKPLLRDFCCLDWQPSINKHEFCITVEIMYYVVIGGDFNNTTFLQQHHFRIL